MLRGIFETLAAVYEVATVVTDVILNAEYIHRKWLEEYILSIVFLVFSGFVMGFVGLGLESSHPNRYSPINAFNKAVAFLIGIFQLRILVETVYSVHAHSQSSDKETLLAQEQPAASNGTEGVQLDSATQRAKEMQARAKQLSQGLSYVAFVQSVVRDMPIFILQANATIHYRKWKFLDIAAVCFTALALLRGVSGYIGKEDHGVALPVLTVLFLGGQWVFRLGSLLLVAMTKGYAIIAYGVVIALLAFATTVMLRLAHPRPERLAQVPRALVFFPFFTFFVVDGSHLSARYGSAVASLRDNKLLAVHAWRFIENCIGIVLAITLPRYTDFGVSTDGEVATIGCICAAVYVVTFVPFWLLAPCFEHREGSTSSSL